MNPIGIIVTLLLVGLVIGLPRRLAPVAVLMGTCYITQGQQLNIAGFHMTSIRFVLLAGIIRVFSRGELAAIKFNLIDRGMMVYIVTTGLRFGGGGGPRWRRWYINWGSRITLR